MTNILITICARGGSKGIPGKNIKELNGKPLISYTIEIAKKFAKRYGAVISLSTESKEIRDVARKFGLITEYDRPTEFASDTSGKIEVIRHLKEFEERRLNISFDYIIDLDVSSPLRTLQDLIEAFECIQNNSEAYNIFSVNLCSKNPYFNMVENMTGDYVKLVKNAGTVLSRQNAPVVYDMNASFYIFRKGFFTENFPSSITPKSLIYEMSHICFDLDEPIDFLFMEYLMSQNLLEFSL